MSPFPFMCAQLLQHNADNHFLLRSIMLDRLRETYKEGAPQPLFPFTFFPSQRKGIQPFENAYFKQPKLRADPQPSGFHAPR